MEETPSFIICTTSFLVSYLDCASYNSVIEETLYALDPKPISVSPSIITQWVTVHHLPSLSESIMAEALKKAGFKICSIVRDY
jgi:P-type Cu+ transporter